MALSESAPSAAVDRPRERRALGVACGAHALHDGYTDLIYVVLPLWQQEFALSYAAVGLLRSIFTGTMASLQIPSTLVAERVGGPLVLACGTALCGLCFSLTALGTSYGWLLGALFLAGAGSATQHPLASALVARTFEGRRSITALGTYNFSGDLGKMAIPGIAALMLMLMHWRPMVAILGLLGLGAALAIILLAPRFTADTETDNAASGTTTAQRSAFRSPGFRLLLAIGAFDSAARAGFLVFVPFLLIAKGATPAMAGLALTLVFVGGAAGKLACAHLGARFGIIGAVVLTEMLTAMGMAAIYVLPLPPTLVLLPFVGVVLNGTSSLTYGSVPQFVSPATRDRAFGIFYTGTIGSGALAPTLSGLIGDKAGLETSVAVVACLTLVTIPIAIALGRYMRANA
ncbi:MAG: MFS transporter [Rhizobiales bacterium]|nr:MFS transporter [Hyphomicrobiales bacterium]